MMHWPGSMPGPRTCWVLRPEDSPGKTTGVPRFALRIEIQGYLDRYRHRRTSKTTPPTR